MTIEEINTRKAEISQELESPEADLDALRHIIELQEFYYSKQDSEYHLFCL